jgi:hypothetical protein
VSVKATVRLDAHKIRRLGLDPHGPIGRQVHQRVVRVEAVAKARTPVQTGRLRASIHIDGPQVGESSTGWEVVAAVAYASWIHEGHREYRRGTGRIVYAHAGPRPFLTEALRAVFA